MLNGHPPVAGCGFQYAAKDQNGGLTRPWPDVFHRGPAREPYRNERTGRCVEPNLRARLRAGDPDDGEPRTPTAQVAADLDSLPR